MYYMYVRRDASLRASAVLPVGPLAAPAGVALPAWAAGRLVHCRTVVLMESTYSTRTILYIKNGAGTYQYYYVVIVLL